MSEEKELEQCHRGFNVYAELKDSYNNEIRIKHSSAFGMGHCWLFCTHPTKRNPEHPELKQDESAHLNVKQAKQVIAGLQKFIKAVEENNWGTTEDEA